MVDVKIKKFNKSASIPQRATEFAGGWDVTVTEIEKKEDDFIICKLGFGLSFPKEYKMTFVPRSSITKERWLISNSPCLGDSDYRQEYQLRFRALPIGLKRLPDEEKVRIENGFRYYHIEHKLSGGFEYPEFPFKVGDRIGQCYLESVIDINFVEVDNLEDSERKGGFGSTGNNYASIQSERI